MIQTFVDQIGDPFRIILLIGLFVTMWRTRGATGIWLPLALGCAFVAVLIPLTVRPTPQEALPAAIGIGLVANAFWLAMIGAAWALWRRITGRP